MPEILDIGDGSQDTVLVRLEAGGYVGWGECESSPLVTIAGMVCPKSHGACRPVLDSVLGQRLESEEDIVRIGNLVRHPQLGGLLTWAVAHLLVNGDSRSLVLFGGLGLWALLAIVATNRRDGAWEKPEPPPLAKDVIGMVVSLVVLAAVIWAHPWLAGVPALPG